MYTLELAQLTDIEICYEIIKVGRDFQKEQGMEGLDMFEFYPSNSI